MENNITKSPFPQNFNLSIIFDYKDCSPNEQVEHQNYINNLTKWLYSTPSITTYRVNTLTHSTDDIITIIRNRVAEIAQKLHYSVPKVEIHDLLPEVIVVNRWNKNELDLVPKINEVIVDVDCAAAVLRGAHIFAPGVIGMLSGTKIGDKVSIYGDVKRKCKKGALKLYDCIDKVFVGNGTVKMARNQLFGEGIEPDGVAIEVYAALSACPALGTFLPKGSTLLQNLPSVICSHLLNPSSEDVILDMCASPGNKTTHLAALMKNKGILIAIDKTPNKVKQLKTRCEEYQAQVNIFQADSTKIFDENAVQLDILNGPPFPSNSFDKILLDAPCSALGKRPQLFNNTSEKVLRSYVPLQRKLFENAVHLLKVNGLLVYSTCTITEGENEKIVAWALKTFDCLELVKPKLALGEPGLAVSELTYEQRKCIQRFGSNGIIDSVGFFIACFVKQKNS